MEPTDNRLLAALPAEELQRLLPRMRRVSLQQGALLCEQDQPVNEAYFFTSGAASVMVLMADGNAMEPAIVGCEGMIGFPIALGQEASRWRSVVQLPGEALVISRPELVELLRAGGDLPLLLAHFASLLISFVAQSAACAQFHGLEQRTARWLLLLQDRAASDQFAITHDALAFMLGAHRPSETVILDGLRRRGLVELQRGQVRIADRLGLRAMACECYEHVQEMYDLSVRVDRLHGGAPGQAYP